MDLAASKKILIAVSLGMLLVGCDNNNNSGGDSASAGMVITPSLGKMINVSVQLRKPDGSEFSPDISTELDSNGTATIAAPSSHTGPIVVSVFTNIQTEYFDESSRTLETNRSGGLPQMSVFLPAVKAEVGVTPFTTMAQFLLAGDTDITADDINATNKAIAEKFGLGVDFDITQPPALIGAVTDFDALDGSDAAKYAAALAALAEVGAGGDRPMADVLNNMIADVADGIFDAAVDGVPQAFVYADLAAEFTTAAAILLNSLPADVDLSLGTITLDFNDLVAGTAGATADNGGSASFTTGTLNISGTFNLNGASVNIPSIVLNNTPVPSGTDFALIEDSVGSQFGAAGSVSVTAVTNTATQLSFRVEFSGVNAGQTVNYSLLYDYTAT